jgi:epoxyqueuosine reductase
MLTNQIVIDKAKELGFDLTGFARAETLEKEFEHLLIWLDSGYHAGMNYMERNIEKRKDFRNIFPNAKSIISLGMNYYTAYQHSNKNDYGKVSRYAWGDDYHQIIWKKLDELVSNLKIIEPLFEAVSYADTGPVMDKVWAVRSGLGWQGKHSNIINKNFGSWFFIATIITSYEFESSKQVKNFCGVCTACIDGCPTKAILPKGYVIDSNKCISYLTIENKKQIHDEFEGKFDDWIFGCDICQDVCPWNKKFSKETKHSLFKPVNKELNLTEVLSLDEMEFERRFKMSPIKRAKLKGLKRNAEFIIRSKKRES